MRKILALLLVTLLFINCDNKVEPSPEDNEKPQMEIRYPVQNASFAKGEEVLLSGSFTDDVDLKEVIITLVSPVEMKWSSGLDSPWEPGEETIELSGKSQVVESKILFDDPIPFDCLSGNYTLKFSLTDKAGKETINTIAIDIL